MKKKTLLKLCHLALLMVLMQFSSLLFAFPRAQMIQGIKGPWELTVSLGSQDSGIVFPVEVTDEDAQQTLSQSFPVLGSPIQVKVLQYCPDLKWKIIVAEDSNRGPVASITIAGKGAEQEIVLLADVPEKRAVTASIGGLAIRELHNTSSVPMLLEKMANEKAIGILTFWTDPNAPPQELVVKAGDSFRVPGTPYTADILAYMPHYSIDRETKEIKNYSDQPANPALKVRLSDEGITHEQWVWSNFDASPHAMSKFPIRVEFSDFDAGPSGNRYFIVTAGESELWLTYTNTHGVQIEKAQMNRPYPFNSEEYTFKLDSFLPHGTQSKVWGNASDRLEHPALVVSVESDKGAKEAVVELNRPTHVKTAYGTLILNYRQKRETKQHGTP